MSTPANRQLDLIVLTVGCVLFSLDAYAYLDPGTGSLILQSVLAAFFGSLFFFRRTWAKLVAKLRSPGKPPLPEGEPQAAPTEKN